MALAKLRSKLQLLRKSASSQHDNCSLGALVWGGLVATTADELRLTTLAGLEESLSEHGELVGRIRVHSTMGLGRAHIAPLVAEFCTRHPRVRVDLELSPLPLNIADATFDIAIRVGSL